MGLMKGRKCAIVMKQAAVLFSGRLEVQDRMLKVLLVDDEILALEDIQAMVDWEDLGFQIIGATTSTRKARELYEQYFPELLIADIVMPVENGTALAKDLKAFGRPLKIFFLTSYEEFSYAKEAIALGVSEYLVKNELDAASLTRVLLKIRNEIERERQGSRLYEKDIFMDYLKSARPRTRILREGYFQMAAVCRRPCVYLKPGAYWEEAGDDIILPKELENDEGIVNCRDENRLVFLFHRDANTKNAAYLLEAMIEGAEKKLDEANSGEIAIIYTGVFQNAEDIFENYQKILVTYGRLPFVTQKRCYSAEDAVYPDREMQEEVRKLLRELESMDAAALIGTQKFSMLAAVLNRLYDKAFLNQATHLMYEMVKKLFVYYGYETEDIARFCAEPIFTTFGLDRCFLELRNKLTEGGAWDVAGEEVFKSRKVAAYIRRHYREDINIAGLAKIFCMSPSQLKKVFKKETGFTVLEYVTECRIRRAKELLNEGELRIGEIADRCGYSTSQYFCKVFKQRTGLTPAEYQKRKWNGD